MALTRESNSGFTLLEVLIVLAIFGVILAGTYEVLDLTLRAEQQIDEGTRAGKIGQAILTQMRRDLSSAVYEDLGRRVFRGVDHGSGEEAEDSVLFLTLAPAPPPPPDVNNEAWGGELTSSGYVLKRGDGQYTLFRRTKWELEEDPLDGGHYFPVYEHVRGLSLRYYDGKEWFDDWDSEARIPEEEEETDATEPGAGDGDGPPGAGANLDDEEEPVLPLPRAVEIELNIYLGDENGLMLDAFGKPVVETYRMVVPIMVMEGLDRETEPTTPDDLPGGG